jgi:hypothetical protein
MRLKKTLTVVETKSNFLDLSKSDLDKEILEESKEPTETVEQLNVQLETIKA